MRSLGKSPVALRAALRSAERPAPLIGVRACLWDTRRTPPLPKDAAATVVGGALGCGERTLGGHCPGWSHHQRRRARRDRPDNLRRAGRTRGGSTLYLEAVRPGGWRR